VEYLGSQSHGAEVRLRMLRGCALLATIGLAVGANTCWQASGDLFGGDLEPLGTGFRNASHIGACCEECYASPMCKFFAYAPDHDHGQVGSGVPYPKHNCWLKATAGTPRGDSARQHGGVSGTGPPTPGPPMPPVPPPCTGTGPQPPWCNLSLSIDARVAAALAEMTVAEKAGQIATETPDVNPGVPRINFPAYSYHSEGLHGLRKSFDTV
jgi:hypothetical protein